MDTTALFKTNKIFRTAIACIVACLIAFISPGVAQAGEVGVVVLHGKMAKQPKGLSKYREYLEESGLLATKPEMPWSEGREFEKDYDSSLLEIKAAVDELRNQGATKVFLVGLSLGGNAAIYYATKYKVDGLVLLAPAHIPQSELFRKAFKDSVARAKEMVAAGKGDEKATFDDMELSHKGSYTIDTTANNYLSYFDPEGPANMELTVVNLPASTPVLMVVSSDEHEAIDPIQKNVWASIQGDKRKKIEVDAKHFRVPWESRDEVVEWLNAFK